METGETKLKIVDYMRYTNHVWNNLQHNIIWLQVFENKWARRNAGMVTWVMNSEISNYEIDNRSLEVDIKEWKMAPVF